MPATQLQTVIALAIAPMVFVTMWLALTSDHLEHRTASALYWAYLTAASMAIGLYWWHRRPASRFGPLLVAFGIVAWLVSWESTGWALIFDMAVLAEAPFFLLTFYLFLSFPMGRIEPPSARWLMVALTAGALAFFLPWALFTPVIAGGAPLTRCAPNCPPNVLQVGTNAQLVEVAGKLETYTALTLTIAVLAVYGRRLLQATSPQRRALFAVAVTSLLFMPAYFASNFAAWVLYVKDRGTLDGLAWVIVATRVLLPLGFLVALLQAESFAAAAQRTLLDRLPGRPDPDEWRDAIATALDDPSLRLGYRDPATGEFRAPDGTVMEPPSPAAHRAWVPVAARGVPVAVLDVDETLSEDPELVRAAAAATVVAVENGALEGELRASRARIFEAGHAERRRIERDLHDSAQQRLVALRIHLGMLGEQIEDPEERALIERFGEEVEQTIDELRSVAHGLYPRVLARQGPVVALRAVAERGGMNVHVTDGSLRRHPEAIETAIYFCCLECVQNAAKHAGRGAAVDVSLGERDGVVWFSVEDDGNGFDPTTVERGAGLTNLADRIAAVGGRLRIEAAPGRGTRVVGELPV